MGSDLSTTISDTMTQKSKYMALANREIMLASTLATARDDVMLVGCFQAVVIPSLFILAIKKNNPMVAAPTLGMAFGLAYLYDVAYGTKIQRVQEEAERILAHERVRFEVPTGNRVISKEEYRVLFEDALARHVVMPTALTRK